MADFKRIIQRTTNSERVETGVADLQPNEICIVEDGEELIYKDRNGKYISVSKDKYKVNTIEELKKSKKYKVGDVVDISWFYHIGLGGGHKRKIELYDDGSGIHLANNLWANYIPSNNHIYASHFGVIGDNLTDNSPILQKMFDYAQKDAPTKVYNIDIDIAIGYILCKTGIDISSNGYCGTISMGNGINYGSLLYFKNDVQQKSALYTKVVMRDGKIYDRFGREFLANGNFKLKNIRIRSEHIKNIEGVAYAKSSDFIDGIDVSSSCYVNVENCHVAGFSGIGINIAKWDTFAEKNVINICGIGIGVSIPTDNNTGEDLVTNNLILEKNNINECKHHIYSKNGTFLKIVGNTLDVSSGASIIVENIGATIIKENYIEASNRDNISSNFRFQSYDSGFVQQDITAKIVINLGSNYNYRASIIVKDNQIPNNTSYKNHPILAINGISNIEYTGNNKRGYEVRDIEFFGIGKNINQYGTLSGKTDISILSPISDDAIKYNLHSTSIYKRIPNANIYCDRENYLFDYNGFLVNSAFDFVGSFKENTTQNVGTKVFYISGTNYAEYDFSTSKNNKPYSLKFFAEQFSSTQYVGGLSVKVYLDDILKFDERICDYRNDGIIRTYVPTIWIGTDYNKLKIELVSDFGIQIKNFCICDGAMNPIFLTNEKPQNIIAQLNDPYLIIKMKEEGVYEDFITYMDAKVEYDNIQREQSNNGTMTLQLLEEPVPSEKLLAFKFKYVGYI